MRRLPRGSRRPNGDSAVKAADRAPLLLRLPQLRRGRIDCFECHASRPETRQPSQARAPNATGARSRLRHDREGLAVTEPGFDPKRRRFLSIGAAAAAVSLAPGVTLYGVVRNGPAQARAPGQPASAKRSAGAC